MKKIVASILLILLLIRLTEAQTIQHITKFANENHPEIGYWFISPSLLPGDNYLQHLDTIAQKCPYTLLFLTARDGANFYNYPLMHPVFQKIVSEAHKKGLKVGLQLWGNYKDTTTVGSQRMIIENEVLLDQTGNAALTIKAKYVRFPDRLLHSDLFLVYAFRKTSEGFYDPATLKDITSKCEAITPDKETVQVRIRGGENVKGLTVCIMTQQTCSQSSMWGDVEINGFAEAMKAYSDIPFDGFALDEYGNKYVAREAELKPGEAFRGRWYSPAMAEAYKRSTGHSLEQTLFDARYAPAGKPEIRISAINEYMDFMRKGALRVETAVNQKSKEIFGKNIFNGIHNTYHNSLVNDEIWANGIGWWDAPRDYGQTDERTPTPTQMGIAMGHTKNAMYNQFYDANLEPVLLKAFSDLRWGIRTHYHALNDKRPLRFDLEFPEAIAGISKIENCARLLNKFNPLLPKINLLVIFGMDALCNWYPNESDRGIYDINDKMKVEEKGLEIWNAGYLNAVVPTDLIVSQKLRIGKDGKPVMNGHTFDAVLFLNPQYAKEPVLKFLEEYEAKGGKLMIEGAADHDFKANDISKRFKAILDKATVKGYSVEALPKLGIHKNLLPDGCQNEDGSYVFTDRTSLISNSQATFSVSIDGDLYKGSYKGIAIIAAEKKRGVYKFAAAGLKELSRNGEVILSFQNPVDIFMTKLDGHTNLTIADPYHKVVPLVNKL
ncbi:MAG: hypothetical protein WCP08_06435 [Prolixibacteraceae bacterium]